MFAMLVEMGFKEIEVGFPAASQTDFDFVRWLIEEKQIPDDVTIQVLVQSREDLIRRTFQAIEGARRVIIHSYNSTSTLQRRVVFGQDEAGITDIAVKGAKLIKNLKNTVHNTEIIHQYSPESFTGTELWYAKNICEAVMDVYEPDASNPVILNLPATVEMSSPNIYADQIEWFARHVGPRDAYILSLHPHNDRGTGIAAAELGLMAGADRVEGTLFGNGERSGNVDVVNIAMNLYSQGITPELDISDIDSLVRAVEYCNNIPVHPRHPYAGELVYTSFSGSHQDAINKGFAAMKDANVEEWAVPYLPIDPEDVGRSYEAVIRVNSQSGKGGITYLLERDYGLKLPRKMLIEFSKVVQRMADNEGAEMSSEAIWAAFDAEYLSIEKDTLELKDYRILQPVSGGKQFGILAEVKINGVEKRVQGLGNGPIDAFVAALNEEMGQRFTVLDYKEHAIDNGSDSKAASFVELGSKDGQTLFGVGLSGNIITSSLRAIICAVNRISA